MQYRSACAIVVIAQLLVASSCRREPEGVVLRAPFDEDAILAVVTATWADSGEERSFADGVRLKEPQVGFQFRVAAENRMGGKLFVRLGEFQLVDEEGLVLAGDATTIECTLGSGETEGVLSGEVWVPKGARERVRDFRLSHGAVPLNELGRALYRKWRLEGRPQQAAEVDAELGRYAAAPPCPSH